MPRLKRYIIFSEVPEYNNKKLIMGYFEHLGEFSQDIARNGFDYLGSEETISILDMDEKVWLDSKKVTEATNKYSKTKL